MSCPMGGYAVKELLRILSSCYRSLPCSPMSPKFHHFARQNQYEAENDNCSAMTTSGSISFAFIRIQKTMHEPVSKCSRGKGECGGKLLGQCPGCPKSFVQAIWQQWHCYGVFLTAQIFIPHASRVKQVRLLVHLAGVGIKTSMCSEKTLLRLRLLTTDYIKSAALYLHKLTPLPHPRK